VTPFKIAGDEYVVINGSDLLGDAQTAAAAVQLELAVEGEQVEGPRLAVVGASSGPTATAEASEAPTTGRAEPGDPGGSDEGGVPALVWVLVAVVAIAVVGVVVALATRGGRARR
jgi:hypothetical protein